MSKFLYAMSQYFCLKKKKRIETSFTHALFDTSGRCGVEGFKQALKTSMYLCAERSSRFLTSQAKRKQILLDCSSYFSVGVDIIEKSNNVTALARLQYNFVYGKSSIKTFLLIDY